MKKLMFAAATVAVAGGAFSAPLVYDYKASAKHMYAKEVRVQFGGARIAVYQKYQKAAALKGYLIVDADGATSQTIVNDQITNNPEFNDGVTWLNGNPATTASDFGRNRAFLVVQNSKAERDVRFPKLIPAVLDAKWIDTRFRVSAAGRRQAAASGLAEGYLYAGGDFGVATRPQLDMLIDLTSVPDTAPAERGALLPQARMIGDYAWQSLWLFGQYNMPLISTGAANNWSAIQAAIDTGANGANLPLTNLYAAGRPFFHDAWMNGAGFGKYIQDAAVSSCCGYSGGATAAVLQTLSGNLKGGLFLCTENGDVLENNLYYKFAAGAVADCWEDQFFCARDINHVGTYAADYDQTDLWQDGELELNTTDCISGTWTIKLRTRNIPRTAITREDLTNLGLAVAANWSEDAPNLTLLMETIKGAALNLNSQAIFSNGREIYNSTRAQLGAHTRMPLMTPSFAGYYGLANFK